MLSFAYILEPLNIFLYTWTFLAAIERKEEKIMLKKGFRMYRWLSICILPILFVGLFAGIVVSQGRLAEARFNKDT